MPQIENKVKRVVSTNIDEPKNPIKSAAKGFEPPFLVDKDGIVANGALTTECLAGEWDVMILSDSAATGLPENVQPLEGPVEVLWLAHGKSVVEVQRPALTRLFGRNISEPTFFHHDEIGYTRYLNAVAALFVGGENYSQTLAKLDLELRRDDLESDVCDLLWLLAAGRVTAGDEKKALVPAAIDKTRKVKAYGPDLAKCFPSGNLFDLSDDEYRGLKAKLRLACRGN